MTDPDTRSVLCDATTVAAWSKLTLDHNPLHVDEEYAATTSFGRTIVQGHLLAALAVDQAVRQGPGVRRVSVRFISPTPVGSTVRLRATGDGQLEVVTDTGDRPILVDLG